MVKNKVSSAASILARQGGLATFKKHGKKHFKKMAKKRWDDKKSSGVEK